MKKLMTMAAMAALTGVAMADPFGARPNATHPYAVHDDLRPNPVKISVNAKGIPSDAIVLFDGTEATLKKNWCDDKGNETKWTLKDGLLVCTPGSGSIRTRQGFGDCQLHVEWRAPIPGQGSDQGRGNSGVILMGKYEIQVLDTYSNRTYADGQAGAVYGQKPPLVNPANPEGEWQTYDIVFHRPVWKDGKQIFGGSFTVFFNGVLTTDNWLLEGPTMWRQRTKPAPQHADKLPLFLQDHGNPVPYRNIWIRPIASNYETKLDGPGMDKAAVAAKRKELAAVAKTRGFIRYAKTPNDILRAKWEVVSYDATAENKQASERAAADWLKTFEGISDKDLIAREAEVQGVVNYGANICEWGSGSGWESELPGMLAARGLLARIARAKKGEKKPTTLIRLNGPIALGKPAPWDKGAPFFNGPNRYGATPKHDFMFLFPVRGSREGLAFSVEKGSLPVGVRLDDRSGVLSGNVAKAGEYRFTVKATNAEGSASRDFTLVIGANARAQTPLMGWTSWNSCDSYADQLFVSRNARELVKRGFAARGYTYVNIDSSWQGLRDKLGSKALQPNRLRFPNMKGLVDEIHGLGLKAGIYSTPMAIAWGSGTTRHGLLLGSYDFPLAGGNDGWAWYGGCGTKSYAKEDAAEWAELGFDYLKYDWTTCDAKRTVEMREALDATGRDFQLCITTSAQWDLFDVYQQNAQLVRSSGDTHDTWPCIRDCLWQCERWANRFKRGAWYDLDMLALGPIAIGNGRVGPAKLPLEEKYRNRLTRDEQIFHFALWAFLPSPLQLSWNLEATDEFTADLVSNEEVLAINQDSAGTGIEYDRAGEGVWVWKRKLADGSEAWLFANPTDKPQTIVWSLGRQMKLRDSLGNRDLGVADGVEVELPMHGVRMIREVK